MPQHEARTSSQPVPSAQHITLTEFDRSPVYRLFDKKTGLYYWEADKKNAQVLHESQAKNIQKREPQFELEEVDVLPPDSDDIGRRMVQIARSEDVVERNVANEKVSRQNHIAVKEREYSEYNRERWAETKAWLDSLRNK